MKRGLITNILCCIVLAIALVALSPVRGQTAGPTSVQTPGATRDSTTVTLKLDPETQKLVQRLAERPETPSAKIQSGDPWSNQEFQTLMSTLWQAPLLIR